MARTLTRKSRRVATRKAARVTTKTLSTKNRKRKRRRKPASSSAAQFAPPFRFPPRHRRIHGPRGLIDYGSYKPWLRDEFEFRCVYCLTRELWSDQGQYGFTIDHVKPKSVHGHLIAEYDNLVYCCFRCNTLKSTNRGLPDPCKVSLAEHVRVRRGLFFGVTPAGQRMVEYLRLNQDVRLPLRRRAIDAYQRRKALDPQILRDTFGYPNDLPDLTIYRPERNTRPRGLGLSHYARREADELPPCY